jgi:hypothetical protein
LDRWRIPARGRVLNRRDKTTARRQYLAVAWAFMLSLLAGASYEMLGDWGRPPDQNDWLSAGAFLAIVHQSYRCKLAQV